MGPGENSFSAGKEFPPCNLPAKIDLREVRQIRLTIIQNNCIISLIAVQKISFVSKGESDMQFPNAFKGIKRIFTSEILMLISQLIFVPIIIFPVIGVNGEELTKNLEQNSPGYLLAFLGLLLAGLIISLVSYIIQITGIVKAAKDEPAFKISLTGVIVGMTARIISYLPIVNYNNMISAICSTVTYIASLVVTFFIIQGIRNIAIKFENDEIEINGVTIFKLYFIIVLINASTHFVSKAFNDDIGSTVTIVLSIAGGILTIAQYVLYISYLVKAKKMLINGSEPEFVIV